MDIKLLIVKAITLIYQESHLTGVQSSTTKPLIKDALEFVKVPENGVDEGLERNSIIHLRATLLGMMQSNDSQPYDKNDLLQRLRINLRGDDATYEAFVSTIIDYDDQEKLLKIVARGKRELKSFVSKEKAKEVFKRASHKMVFNSNDIGDLDAFLKSTMAQLAEIGISVELIDVQTLLPFDIHGVIGQSIQKTSRVVFFDEDVPGGATAFMMQKVLEEQKGFRYLDSAPRTVTGREHRPAYGTDGDYFSNPSAEDIYEAIYDLMEETNPGKYPAIYG